MKAIMRSVITALCINFILIGMEISLGMEFGLAARILIAVPATVLIGTFGE
jgi:hypothetical protein